LQVLALAPLLEQSPDQIASRPPDTLKVINVPGANCATPVVPVGTLSPAGLETMVCPLRPPAVTPSESLVGAANGFTVSVADLVTPPPVTEIVTGVDALPGAVLMMTPPVVLQAGI